MLKLSVMMMQSLPEELLLRVFQQLEQSKVLMMSRVSQTWSRVARDQTLWRSVELTFRTCHDDDFIDQLIGELNNS